MSDAPRVSVGIPVYNAEKYIGAAIDSVLAQTYTDFELIVVDNCSTDGSASIVEAYDDPRIRFLRNETNIGAAGNWNRSMEEARGEYVKLVCADDLLRPECLAKQVAALDAHPEAAFVSGHRDIVDAEGNVLIAARGPRRHGEIPPHEALRMVVRSGTNPFGEPATVLMRSTAREKAGNFTDERGWIIDVELWCRLLEHGSVVVLPDNVAGFRVSQESWSIGLARQQSRQARTWFVELREQHPDIVRPVDIAVGAANAWALAMGRRALYAAMRRRARRA